MDVYRNISRSHLHKVIARSMIIPCLEIVRIMVYQEYLSNQWLLDSKEQPLSSYQPEELHEKYYLPKLEIFITT